MASRAKTKRKACVYRHFDAKGVLLYIGVSLTFRVRTECHSYASAWFDEIVRIEIERFDTMAEAIEAEGAAIKAERPKHNKLVVRGRGGRPYIGERHRTLEATKPWVKLGISRRSYFRKKAEGDIR